MSKTRIVVAGGGIAGVPLAYQLKTALHGSVEITVVSDRSQFHFVPANPWLALNLRREDEVSFALKPLLAARKIALRTQAVTAIHPDDNRLTLADGEQLDYDYLALATGIQPDWARIPCTGPGTDVHSVIRRQDAQVAHNAYLEFLKQPGPVVVAAAAGASLLGPMYEYAFLLDADLRRRGLRARVPISLITPEPYPGHLGLDKPVASDALRIALDSHEINWVGNAEIQNCHDRRLNFISHTKAGGRDEQSLDFAYALLWPPFRGIDAVTQCPGLSDEHGLVVVDDALRSPAHENIFAVGACTAKSALTSTPVPVGVPDAVYAVQQQVAVVRRNIIHSLHDQPLENASTVHAHWINDEGKRGAAHLAVPQMPLRDINWLRGGRWVFEAKRDFEDYFFNRILFGAGKHGHVTALVRRLSSRSGQDAVTAASPSPGDNLIIDAKLRHRIEVLARELGVNGRRLARQLLDNAMAEALSCLDPETRQRLDQEVDEHHLNELEAEKERVRFEGGAP